MILFGMHRIRAFTVMFGMAMVALVNSCAPTVHMDRVKFQGPDYIVKEVRVTGRPILEANTSAPKLRIDGFDRPDRKPFHIDGPVPTKVLEQTLDQRKSYRFHLLCSTCRLSPGAEYSDDYDVTLSKVEDDHSVILDASVCDVHHCPMDFVMKKNIDGGLLPKKALQKLEIFHNHGYAIRFFCSWLSPGYEWAWRCPEYAKKADVFKSKFEH